MIGMAYPEVSPIMFQIGPLAIRWYSMAYLIGILLGWWIISKRVKKYNINMSSADVEDLIFYYTLGVILGGRLGYVLFYGDGRFLSNPLEIFAIWNGGMSFHGGIFGVIAALYMFARKCKKSFLEITDIVSPLVPLGIFFGRIANFMNDELWGRVTDVAWAVRFPRGGFLPRHPSQIYEALTEGLCLFIILNFMWRIEWCRKHTGFISASFLLGYALMRSLMEQFREPDSQIGFLFGGITMGQMLSFPLIVIGSYIIANIFRKKISKQ